MREYTDAELLELAILDDVILNTARGFCGLKMYQDAELELAKASRFSKTRADFLEIQSLINAENSQWREALRCAEAMIDEEPDNEFGYQFRADAIRHLNDVRAAYECLAGVMGKFPASPLVKYNLGCFACVGGELFSARKNLIQTFQLAEQTAEVNFFKNLATGDADLKKLWPEIGRIVEMAQRLNQTQNEKFIQN